MDTTDSRISFDSSGVSDHVTDFFTNVEPRWRASLGSKGYLQDQINKIKKAGSKREYDCILGLSGGIDSSYMLHMAVKEFGLRPLVFHVDGGWNSELAVHNIQSLVDQLGLDLFTEVINWEEMRDFQLAMFKSGVPHLDIPQDHAFIATLYKYANKYNIPYILNGGNLSTECVRNPLEYYYHGTDLTHVFDILRKFGTVDMKSYPFSSIFGHKLYLRYIRRIKVVRPLNSINYIKSEASEFLQRHYGWKPYPQKHFESVFTRFLESYWLPERFGFDPRRVQLSSLILTGQITRQQALDELTKPPYDTNTITQDFEYIANKLAISTDELRHYFLMPKKFYWDYKNQMNIFAAGSTLLKSIGLEYSVKR